MPLPGIKFSLLFLLIAATAMRLSAQETKTFPLHPVSADSVINISADSSDEYEIIYEIDTIRQTKIIIDYDTVYQYETRTAPADTAKTVINKPDSTPAFKDTSVINRPEHFSAGVNFSSFVFTDNFSSGKTADEETYINYRKIYEEPQTSYSLEFSAAYHFNKWSIKSGLNYTVLKKKYNYPYNKETLLQKIIRTDTSYIALLSDTVDSYYQIDQDNDTLWFYVIHNYWSTVHDSVSHLYTDTLRESLTNRGIQYYRFLEVPLIFGCELLRLKNLKIGVNAGIITSLLTYRKGEIVSFSGAPDFTGFKNQPLYKASFSAYTGLSAGYAVSKNLTVLLSPYYLRGITSLLNKSFPVSQTLNRKGITVGLYIKY